MENRRDNCTGNSNDKQTRNITKKCYSLPVLQRENEKLKQDLSDLQAAYDEKETLLTESLGKVKLLEKENRDLKEKVEVKDVSTNVTIETVDVPTSLIEISDVSASSIATSEASSIETQNESASSSVVHTESNIQGEKKAVCKTLLFGETVRKLPYQEKHEIIMFDRNMMDPKFSSDMEKHFKKIGGANTSKVVNNILNAIATKNVQKQFVWDSAADNSFQNLKNILACIYSVVCSEEITRHKVNNIIQNTLSNARSKS